MQPGKEQDTNQLVENKGMPYEAKAQKIVEAHWPDVDSCHASRGLFRAISTAIKEVAEAKDARIFALEEALKPFLIDYYGDEIHLDDDLHDSTDIDLTVKATVFRRAAALLSEGKEEL